MVFHSVFIEVLIYGIQDIFWLPGGHFWLGGWLAGRLENTILMKTQLSNLDLDFDLGFANYAITQF